MKRILLAVLALTMFTGAASASAGMYWDANAGRKYYLNY